LKVITVVPSCFQARVATVTMPWVGRDFDARFSSTVDSAYSVSPLNTGAGIVSVKTVGLNQEGVKVCEFNRAMLIMKRSGNDVEVKANY